MVTRRRVLLLERRLVLLVDDDETKALERQEYGATSAQDHIVRIGRQLFSPYLHPFGVAVFGMVDTQLIAKHPEQALGHLYGECDFGQQVEHLLVFLEHLGDEMDIDLCLSARSHAMEEHHVASEKLEQDIVVGLLLQGIEPSHVLGVRFAAIVEPSHLAPIGAEDLPVDEAFHHRGLAVRRINQFVARDFHGRLGTHLPLERVVVRQCEVVDQHLLLLWCPDEHIECDMERLLVAELWRKGNEGLHPRFVALLFQSGRQGRHIDIAERRHIVVGDPLPEVHLQVEHHRSGVEHALYLPAFEVGLAVVQSRYQCDVPLRLAQRHRHPCPHPHLLSPLRRHGIGEDTFER